MSDKKTGDWCGMLQPIKQLAQRDDHRPDQLPRPEFLLEFIRALIQNNPNGDILSLSLLQAAKITGATDEEVEVLRIALREISSARTPWPNNFYSEL